MTWDANQYNKFAAERERPFADLVEQAAQSGTEIRQIVDLGCGPGRLTQQLAERWPAAHVVGVDNSPEMLAKAQPLAIPDRLEFVQADLAIWSPDQPVDLILSNAALHWIADHDRLLTRLAGWVAPSGTLAVQMPNRFDGPVQKAIDETAADPRWAAQLRGVGLHRGSVQPIDWYVRFLQGLGFAVNAWETTYVHVLSGENPVLEWFRGTGLRPLLARLDRTAAEQFSADLAARLTALYPPHNGTTLFPMPRLFFVATRAAGSPA
ncbi:MAG TPA: methyltransferase domain-containing protein [Planctomycetaceae bacterium]|jgi:trans-aconitate 2-methyltransferase|nr:methyltransferase domain-containing protein [Planctomycetaceae bacterium]